MEKLYTLPQLAEMRGYDYDTLDKWAKDGILKVQHTSTAKQARRKATIPGLLAAEKELERRRSEPKPPKLKKPRQGIRQTPEEYFKSVGIII